MAGATGHGNSTFLNSFVVTDGTTTQAFCTQAGDPVCNGIQSVVGDTIKLFLPAGNIDFLFNMGSTGQNSVANDAVFDPVNNQGAYLAQIGLGATPNPGAGNVAYLGLADQTVSPTGDQDFQDLTLRVSVPEPGSVALLGVGLLALVFIYRRKAMVQGAGRVLMAA